MDNSPVRLALVQYKAACAVRPIILPQPFC